MSAPYFFSASISKLDAGDLITSYMKTLEKNLSSGDVSNLNNLTEYDSGATDLQNFLYNVLKIGLVTIGILWITF